MSFASLGTPSGAAFIDAIELPTVDAGTYALKQARISIEVHAADYVSQKAVLKLARDAVRYQRGVVAGVPVAVVATGRAIPATVATVAVAVATAARMDTEVLCEEFIAGDEVTCPVLGPTDQPRALPLIRIVAPDGNYDYQNKYFTDTTQYLVPAGLPAGEEEAIAAIVCKAYQVLGCRGWARADVMIDATTRQPYLLEINTSPGMTGHSLVPMSASASGTSYEDLCVQLLAHAALDAKH